MTRQEALITLWKRLLIVLCVSLIVCIVVFYGSKKVPAHTAILVFLIGNIGSYVSVHRGLGDLKDAEVIELSASWWAIVVPSYVGGVLALVMYFLFMSQMISGQLFPNFVEDQTGCQGVGSLRCQSAKHMTDYAKLFFWSFVAGFNQKYVVDIINSVRAKP